MIQDISLKSKRNHAFDSSSELESEIFWQSENPSHSCSLAFGLDETCDELGESVAHLTGVASLFGSQRDDRKLGILDATLDGMERQRFSALLKGKVVLLMVGSEAASAEGGFFRLLREQIYRLRDSDLRPFCKKNHRPFPIREKRAETPKRVSSALVDAGTVLVRAASSSSSFDAASKERVRVSSVQAVLSSVLEFEPALVFVCSDASSSLETVYAAHAASKQGDVLPLIMLSSRMELSVASSEDHIAHGRNLIASLAQALLNGKALLQLGVQRELNAQRDYDEALKSGIWVVEYMYLLGMWRNAMNGREVSPLEHLYDHLDKLGPMGWKKNEAGLHLAFDLNVLSDQMNIGCINGRPFGCTLQDLGPIMTYLGRTGLCRVAHVMAEVGHAASPLKAAELISTLVYKFVLLREEYSQT